MGLTVSIACMYEICVGDIRVYSKLDQRQVRNFKSAYNYQIYETLCHLISPFKM
jgi:hypothetical protein